MQVGTSRYVSFRYNCSERPGPDNFRILAVRCCIPTVCVYTESVLRLLQTPLISIYVLDLLAFRRRQKSQALATRCLGPDPSKTGSEGGPMSNTCAALVCIDYTRCGL